MGGAAAGVAAAAARARRRVTSHFLSRGAVSPDKAVTFVPDRQMERKFFERLCEKGVIVPGEGDSFYLDAPKFDAYRKSRRKRMRMMVAGLATALAAGVGIGLLG